MAKRRQRQYNEFKKWFSTGAMLVLGIALIVGIMIYRQVDFEEKSKRIHYTVLLVDISNEFSSGQREALNDVISSIIAKIKRNLTTYNQILKIHLIVGGTDEKEIFNIKYNRVENIVKVTEGRLESNKIDIVEFIDANIIENNDAEYSPIIEGIYSSTKDIRRKYSNEFDPLHDLIIFSDMIQHSEKNFKLSENLHFDSFFKNDIVKRYKMDLSKFRTTVYYVSRSASSLNVYQGKSQRGIWRKFFIENCNVLSDNYDDVHTVTLKGLN